MGRYPSAESCNGRDDDCDGEVDELGTLTCGIGVCESSVPACTAGNVSACLPGAPAGSTDGCNGEDDDCDGAVDEDCPDCVRVAPTGNDEMALASDGATPFSTVQAAIDFADGHRRLVTNVCVAAGDSCGATATFDGPASADLTMRNGVSVLGKYESTSFSRCATSTTILAPQTGRGVFFPASVSNRTVLDGFSIARLRAPTTRGVTLDGAQGVVLSNLTIEGLAATGSVPEVSHGVNLSNGADALVWRSRIDGGWGVAAAAVASVDSRVLIEDSCPVPVDAVTGRCSATCPATGPQISAGPTTYRGRQDAVVLENSPGSRIERSLVCANVHGDSGGGAAIQVRGNGDGLLIRATTVGGSLKNPYQDQAGIALDDCGGQSPWIADNASIRPSSVGGPTSGPSGGTVTALRVRGDCHPVIESNSDIGVTVGADNFRATAIECAASGAGASRCVITKNPRIGTQWNGGEGSQGTRSALGVVCSGGSCARIDRNEIIGLLSHAGCLGCSISSVGLSIAGGRQFVDRNIISGGPGTSGRVPKSRSSGMSASGSARIQNNLISGSGSNEGTGLGFSSAAPPNEMEIHSNSIFGTASGAELDSRTFCTGLRLSGEFGIVRNNIIGIGTEFPTTCYDDGVVVRESQASHPSIFENNDVMRPSGSRNWSGDSVYYLDDGVRVLHSVRAIDDLPDVAASNTLDASCPQVNGELASGSPCMDTGTSAGAPLWDFDGEPRDATPDIGPDELVCNADLQSNPDHCGRCGRLCSPNHMATRTCGDGACNGACAAGFFDCNGDKERDGCEADGRYDDHNCGGCGIRCAEGESCLDGACQVCPDGGCGFCDASVLFLGDEDPLGNGAVRGELEAVGLTVTVIDSGMLRYDGVPIAASFDTVVVLANDFYWTTIQEAGQQAIVDANTAGTGFVTTSGHTLYGGPLDGLKLFRISSRLTGSGSMTLTAASHPIWYGLPSMITATSTLVVGSGTILNGGTSIATCSLSSTAPGVVVKDATGGAGRVVYLGQSADYRSGWLTDALLVKQFVNAVKWSAGCE